MPSFNLIDEGWIPCVMEDGSIREFGLRDTLLRSPDIRELVDPSPLVTAALHRLLLAILHRNFGPKDFAQWRDLWNKGLDAQTLSAYFERWRHHFDIFDNHRPFYQSGRLDFRYEVSVSKLEQEVPSGYNILFDHSYDEPPETLTAAKAARYLVAHQAFAVGGLVSLERGQDPKLFKSANAAPLTKAAVALVKGQNLFQTLMLNMHQYEAADEEPFKSEPDDAPAWEQNEPTGGDRYPKGYLDLLTWQSRLIRLHPEMELDGRPVVRRVVIMKGCQFPAGWPSHGHETMVAFRRNLKATRGMDPWPPIGFQEERALWRDSLVLFQSWKEERDRPKTLDWVDDLASESILEFSQTLQLELFGILAERAKVLLWRHERLPLPLAYLNDKDLLDKLKEALDIAEQVGKLFLVGFDKLGSGSAAKTIPRPFQILAGALLSTPGGRPPDQNAIKSLVNSLSPERAYWPHLESPFKRFMVELPADKAEESGGIVHYGDKVLPQWAETLRSTAQKAFRKVTGSLDTSARTLKALAMAERRFKYRLNEVLKDYNNTKGGKP